MKQLVLACARCTNRLEIPVESLLLAVDAGTSEQPVARLGYICPTCEVLVDEPLPARALLMLVRNGGEVIDYEWERS